MKNTNKVLLGFCFSVMAFCMTINAMGTTGFTELSPVMNIMINELNGYHLIMWYALTWALIFTIFKYTENRVDEYYSSYMANIILMVGFFDFVHNCVILGMA